MHFTLTSLHDHRQDDQRQNAAGHRPGRDSNRRRFERGQVTDQVARHSHGILVLRGTVRHQVGIV